MSYDYSGFNRFIPNFDPQVPPESEEQKVKEESDLKASDPKTTEITQSIISKPPSSPLKSLANYKVNPEPKQGTNHEVSEVAAKTVFGKLSTSSRLELINKSNLDELNELLGVEEDLSEEELRLIELHIQESLVDEEEKKLKQVEGVVEEKIGVLENIEAATGNEINILDALDATETTSFVLNNTEQALNQNFIQIIEFLAYHHTRNNDGTYNKTIGHVDLLKLQKEEQKTFLTEFIQKSDVKKLSATSNVLYKPQEEELIYLGNRVKNKKKFIVKNKITGAVVNHKIKSEKIIDKSQLEEFKKAFVTCFNIFKLNDPEEKKETENSFKNAEKDKINDDPSLLLEKQNNQKKLEKMKPEIFFNPELEILGGLNSKQFNEKRIKALLQYLDKKLERIAHSLKIERIKTENLNLDTIKQQKSAYQSIQENIVLGNQNQEILTHLNQIEIREAATKLEIPLPMIEKFEEALKEIDLLIRMMPKVSNPTEMVASVEIANLKTEMMKVMSDIITVGGKVAGTGRGGKNSR